MAGSERHITPMVARPEDGELCSTMYRPVSGATHHRELPRGRHPVQLYSHGTWNGMKVTILLEELLALGLKGAEYDAWLIDILRGDQFGSGFVQLNPNSKVPAMIDHGADQAIAIFESGAILFYLADKFGQFLPQSPPARAECLSWLFWQVGSVPYVGGGFARFHNFAPAKLEYAVGRYTIEVKRQLHLLDLRLADRSFILGNDYSIADIAIFPWYGGLILGWGCDSCEYLSPNEYQNLRRWAEMVRARPAVQRGRRVNMTSGTGALRERHDAADFDK